MSAADVEAVCAAGFSDEQIVEMLAHVSLNLFTNYVNVAFAVPRGLPFGEVAALGLSVRRGV